MLFYRNALGRCPIEEFLDSLPAKTAQKVSWVLSLVRDLDMIPVQYLKKLSGSKDIWECRIVIFGISYRLFCFFDKDGIVVLTHGISKKTHKTPPEEIQRAEEYKADWLRRK